MNRTRVLLAIGALVLLVFAALFTRTSQTEVCRLCGRTKTAEWFLVVPLGETISDTPVSKLADELHGGECAHKWEAAGTTCNSIWGGCSFCALRPGRHTLRVYASLAQCLQENRVSVEEAKEYLKKIPVAEGRERGKLETELQAQLDKDSAGAAKHAD